MASPLHGFYYTHKEPGLCGLKLSPEQTATMRSISAAPFAVVPHEIYWKRFGRYLITHTAQGYVAWDGVPHWIIGNCERIWGESPDDEDGVNVLRFHPDHTFTYQWFTGAGGAGDEDEDAYDPVHDLVFTPWDWLLDGVGDDEMFPLSEAQVAALDKAVEWTDALHQDLERKWPRETNWA